MPTLRLDTVPDASYEAQGLNARYVRTGYVDDIELEAGGDAEALVRIRNIQNFPPMNSALSASHPELILQRIAMFPSLTKFRRVRLMLEYSTLPIIPTVYSIREETFDSAVELDYIPAVPGFEDVANNGINELLINEYKYPEPATPPGVVVNPFDEDVKTHISRPAT